MIIENKELLIQLLANALGVEKKFTTKDVFFVINNVAEPVSDKLKKVNQDRKALREALLIANKAAAVSLKSLGHVMEGLGNHTTGGLRLVRHKTKSKKPVKHWIVPVDDVVRE